MTNDDVVDVVKIHLASFPEFFLSYLGAQFLSFFYSGIVSASEGISFVCQDMAGNLCGFVVGSSDPRGFYSRLLKRDWLKFSLASLSAICRKPSIIPRVARALIYPGMNPAGDDIAGLFSIAVLPISQGKGVGKKLVFAFLNEAKVRGCKRIFLTTDRDNNSSVNSFYQKSGFSVERQFRTPEGRYMNEYSFDLLPKGPLNA